MIFVTPMIFRPNARIIKLPAQLISAIALVDKIGAKNCANSTIPPWNTSTNTAESKTPMPSVADSIMEEIKSSRDLVSSISLSPLRPAFNEPTMVMAPIQNNRHAVINP